MLQALLTQGESDSPRPTSLAQRLCRAPPIPWRYGAVYLLCAASLALPMTARGILFNRTLGLAKRPELLQAYYMAEWSMVFTSPIIGWLTDQGGPIWRRRTVVASLVVNMLFMLAFAGGLVRSLGELYLFGLPAAALHSFAIAAINGALIAHGDTHGGSDTTVARSRQSAKLVCATSGDLLAFGASTALESLHASQALVFILTAFLVSAAAIIASTFPVPPSRAGHADAEVPCPQWASLNAVTATAAVPTGAAATVRPATCGSARAIAATGTADPTTPEATAGCCVASRTGCSRPYFATVVVGALAAAVFTLPPTSFDVVSSCVYSQRGEQTTPAWLLSAMQMTGMAGSLLGTCVMWWLDLPLRASMPVGALAFALGSTSQLWLVYGSNGRPVSPSNVPAMLLQPALQSTLVRCGLIPIYNLGANAAGVGSEGGGYAVVMAMAFSI